MKKKIHRLESEILIDTIINNLESLDFNSEEAREIVRETMFTLTSQIYSKACDKMNKKGFIQVNNLLEIIQNI